MLGSVVPLIKLCSASVAVRGVFLSIAYLEIAITTFLFIARPAAVLFEYIGEYSFQNTHLRTITIPKSIIEIAKVAFSGNDSLISIYLEDGIGIINDDAFASCINLKDVYCYSETVPLTKGNGIFGGYYQDAVLHVPKKGVENYKNNIEWSRQFKEIVSIEEEGNKSSFGWILAFILFILTLLFCKKKALNRYNE